MRTFCLLVLSAAFSTSAMAWDSTTENVEFEAQTKLFNEVEFTGLLPSADSPLAIGFTADNDAILDVNMLANSELTWPDDLTQNWEGIERAGNANLTTTTDLEAFLHLDFWGYEIDVPLWERQYTWAGTAYFDTLLLPGGTETATVELAETVLFGLDTELEVLDGVWVYLGGDLYPAASATITGTSVSTNGQEILEKDGTTSINVPITNDGTVEMESEWQGTVDGTFGIDLVPWVTVCVDDWMCIDVAEFTYPWEISTDHTAIISNTAEFSHAIPALVPSTNAIDMGTVLVGEEITIDLSMHNLGAMELEGRALLEGDAAFTLIEDHFVASLYEDGFVTVSFAPTEEGAFTGVITLTSNDPVNPTIQIPVIGNADPQPMDETGDDRIDGENGTGAARGCGCNSTPAPATTGFLGLGLLGLLLRRRSR